MFVLNSSIWKKPDDFRLRGGQKKNQEAPIELPPIATIVKDLVLNKAQLPTEPTIPAILQIQTDEREFILNSKLTLSLDSHKKFEDAFYKIDKRTFNKWVQTIKNYRLKGHVLKSRGRPKKT